MSFLSFHVRLGTCKGRIICNEKGEYVLGPESPWGKPSAQTEVTEADQAGKREQAEAEKELLDKREVLSAHQDNPLGPRAII